MAQILSELINKRYKNFQKQEGHSQFSRVIFLPSNLDFCCFWKKYIQNKILVKKVTELKGQLTKNLIKPLKIMDHAEPSLPILFY